VLTGPGGEKMQPAAFSWDAGSKTYFLQFDNHPDGVKVNVRWE
jgi:hypothetical protein